jgi:hypothetical protein
VAPPLWDALVLVFSASAPAYFLRQIGSRSGASSVCAALGLVVVQVIQSSIYVSLDFVAKGDSMPLKTDMYRASSFQWLPLSVLWWPSFGSLDLGS